MRRAATGLAALLAAVAICMTAGAASAAAAPRPDDLWATVNICDTLRYPDIMGVRASMPGNGTHEHMWMRFHAQYYNQAKKTWFDVKGNGVSAWILAGSARYRSRQAGYNFNFAPPTAGSTYVLRGVVDFQWRARRRVNGKLRWVVVHRARANTKGGHSTDTADPPGYSSGLCEIH